jgi:hypothetical protein
VNGEPGRGATFLVTFPIRSMRERHP